MHGGTHADVCVRTCACSCVRTRAQARVQACALRTRVATQVELEVVQRRLAFAQAELSFAVSWHAALARLGSGMRGARVVSLGTVWYRERETHVSICLYRDAILLIA